jgi:NAD(P)H dehydrogenase (quinone)
MTTNGFGSRPALAVAYHSGFGHTAALAGAVVAGVTTGGADVEAIAVDAMTDVDWDVLDGADAIIFGTPTYGQRVRGLSGLRRADRPTLPERHMARQGRGGFTNSGGKSGDKLSTLMSLAVFAAQHHMHWVNLGLVAGWNSSTASEQDPNRLGFFLGAGAQTNVDASPKEVHPSDARTCEHLGRRVATVTSELIAGRAAAH